MLSVIVPVFNEQENIEPLLQEIAAVSNQVSISEIIYIDDGSTDDSLNTLISLQQHFPMLRIVQHSKRAGQSAAFLSGIRAAGNALVVLMDGDGQNDPKDIEKLFECYQSGTGPNKKVMVAGQRAKRNDNFIRRVSSRLANRIRSAMLQDGIRDTGCSLKLIRREDYLR
ncbi:MAG: glycosyltransferase family 2 protein, partial [Rhodospirillales bacterium]|nr:glycosyltransferase family 2 protein [Rhodospirillales bacterium]